MNKAHSIEAGLATLFGIGFLSASNLALVDHAISSLAALAGLAWWFRLWLKDPNKKPPGVPAIALGALGAFLVGGFASGCATNHVDLTTQRTDTNGVVTVSRSQANTTALWPATTELARQRLANTPHGQSLGTEGLHEEGGGTNLVNALHELNTFLGHFKP